MKNIKQNFTSKTFLKGERIYKKLKSKLERSNYGKIIAIDPSSGRYVIGTDELKIALLIRKDFPGKVFDFFRIGYPAVHKFRKPGAL